jgi:hypothetical protein
VFRSGMTVWKPSHLDRETEVTKVVHSASVECRIVEKAFGGYVTKLDGQN